MHLKHIQLRNLIFQSISIIIIFPISENRFVVVLIEDAVPLMSPVMVHLDEGDYVYSTFSGKVTLPACTSDHPRSGNMPEEIVLPPVLDSDLPDAPQTSLCPDLDHSCPKCESVDDDELKNIVCASDNGKRTSSF